MDYFHFKIEEEAKFAESTPLRRAFREHLKKIATALHDIEWVDLDPGAELAQVLAEARLLQGALHAALRGGA